MRLATLAAVATLTGVGAIAFAQSDQPSKSLSFATYKEHVGRVKVIVGSSAAALNDGEAYFPLQIGVGVRGRGPELTFTDESFTLIDQDGTRYPMASLNEIRATDGLLEFNEQLFRSQPLVTGQQFTNSVYIQSDFFPRAGVRIATVHLSRESFFVDAIYFPRPNVGLSGLLTLRIQPSGADTPIDVRFEIPLKGKNQLKRQSRKQGVERDYSVGSSSTSRVSRSPSARSTVNRTRPPTPTRSNWSFNSFTVWTGSPLTARITSPNT